MGIRIGTAIVIASTLALLVPYAPHASHAAASERARKPATNAAEPAMKIDPATVEKLRSNDPAQVKAALDDVRTAGKTAQAAAPLIAQLLERGLPADLTLAAIETLSDLEAEPSSDALSAYASHRVTSIRQAAIKALVHTKGPAAVRALRHALSDGDAVVRGLAATGLGSLKAKEAVPELFLALDHRVAEAAASIGILCSPTECAQLAGKLGKLPFDVVTSGLDQVLFRPPSEINDDEKVKVVGRIRELGTPEANRFLQDVQKRWPATWSTRVKQSIDQAVLATAGVVTP